MLLSVNSVKKQVYGCIHFFGPAVRVQTLLLVSKTSSFTHPARTVLTVVNHRAISFTYLGQVVVVDVSRLWAHFGWKYRCQRYLWQLSVHTRPRCYNCSLGPPERQRRKQSSQSFSAVKFPPLSRTDDQSNGSRKMRCGSRSDLPMNARICYLYMRYGTGAHTDGKSRTSWPWTADEPRTMTWGTRLFWEQSYRRKNPHFPQHLTAQRPQSAGSGHNALRTRPPPRVPLQSPHNSCSELNWSTFLDPLVVI